MYLFIKNQPHAGIRNDIYQYTYMVCVMYNVYKDLYYNENCKYECLNEDFYLHLLTCRFVRTFCFQSVSNMYSTVN